MKILRKKRANRVTEGRKGGSASSVREGGSVNWGRRSQQSAKGGEGEPESRIHKGKKIRHTENAPPGEKRGEAVRRQGALDRSKKRKKGEKTSGEEAIMILEKEGRMSERRYEAPWFEGRVVKSRGKEHTAHSSKERKERQL